MAFLIYKYRGSKLPYQSRIQTMWEKVSLQDTSLADTLLTEEQRLQLEDMSRREKLDKREESVDQQEKSLAVRVDSLKNIQEDIQRLIKQKEQLESERLAKLAAVYGAMRPEVAAPIIQELPDVTIAAIFTQMKERQAAKILGAMPPDRAAEISRRMGRGQ